MSIPGGISVPGAELVLRARELAPDPNTRIIVNCAGRTRSIIGTQSLVHAGIPNQVNALRNGTIVLAASRADAGAWAEPSRTTYLFDVRTPEEFEGHLPGAFHTARPTGAGNRPFR